MIRTASFICVLSIAAAPAAFAQATRTWVSGVGDDANPCSRTAPCKTFAGAISKTAALGEIDVLDPGGFGALTITKSITIDGRGAIGSVLVSGSNGITVQATVATDVVTLRGLSFNGIGAGLIGVKFIGAGGALNVEDCVIANFTGRGIDFQPTASGKLSVRNTTLRNNAGGGIFVSPATGSSDVFLLATVSRSTLVGGPVGIDAAAATGSARVTVQDSVISFASAYGVHAQAGAEINFERGAVTNGAGVGVQSEGSVRLSSVMVSDNVTGLATSGSGTIASFGNNKIAAGNGTNGQPTQSIPLQ